MSDNLPDQNQPKPEGNAENTDRQSWRQQRREERRTRRGGNSWIGGAVLILIGLVLLLQNFGKMALQNWWALFILIPALGAFANAWRTYQQADGHLTGAARSSLLGGFILTMVAAVFLFNLNWALLGPVLLILAGIGIFVNVILPG